MQFIYSKMYVVPWNVYLNYSSHHILTYESLVTKLPSILKSPDLIWSTLQVNLFLKHLLLHQLTHNMTKVCSLNYKFSTWKLQAQNMFRTSCVHKLFLFWHSEQFMYTTCSEHVLRLQFSCTELVIQWQIFCHIVG